MGSILFSPEILGDTLSETAGYKSGLALSIEEMCDHLNDTGYADLLITSEKQMVRLHSTEYDELFYKLLYRIGYTEEEYDGDIIGVNLFHKYKNTDLAPIHEGVLELFIKHLPLMIEEAATKGEKLLNSKSFMESVAEKYGRAGLDMALERIETMNRGLNLSPHTGLRYTEWGSIEALESLFKGGSGVPERGKFIDQRFLNYLYANQDKLKDIHWRKFEELTAEYFDRDGYNVELGPGSNDDGVDVRVWKRKQNMEDDPPHLIIQCKRQKKKIEKVVVKGLYADVQFQRAEYGLIVTSSELSKGARKVISVRGYPIKEIDNDGLRSWLQALHKPGTGVVRV